MVRASDRSPCRSGGVTVPGCARAHRLRRANDASRADWSRWGDQSHDGPVGNRGMAMARARR